MIKKSRRREILLPASHPERSASGAQSKDPVKPPCDPTPDLPPSATGEYWIYILSNARRTVLYVGITNSLSVRLSQHLCGEAGGFTKDYRTTDLVYYENFPDPLSAIAREKQLKGWTRKKKDALIAKMNPRLLDLAPTLFGKGWKEEVRSGSRMAASPFLSAPPAPQPPLSMPPMETATP